MQLAFVLSAVIGMTYVKLGVGSQIAFTARADSTTSVRRGEIIKFPFVKTNIGGQYNPDTGIFTCNKNGLYVFSLTITCQTSGYIFVELTTNTGRRLFDLSSPYLYQQKAPSACTATVYLEKEEQVKVVAIDDANTAAISDMSYFTGYYLGE